MDKVLYLGIVLMLMAWTVVGVYNKNNCGEYDVSTHRRGLNTAARVVFMTMLSAACISIITIGLVLEIGDVSFSTSLSQNVRDIISICGITHFLLCGYFWYVLLNVKADVRFTYIYELMFANSGLGVLYLGLIVSGHIVTH